MKSGRARSRASGNLPEWAKGSAARFFAAADDHERANGNAYREFEMALPIELSDAERGRLVREFVAEQIGDRHAYTWAIHEPRGHNPHVHVMFSERIRDGMERGKEQYFKRANSKNPERGGHLKSDWFTGKGGPEAVEALRARWAEVQNQALERAGVEARVDHRSLEAQGIEREAGQHRGPALSGIEARGEEAEVSARREAEQVERAQARAAVVAEVRVVTREEVAAERVAVRERRELAREVTGEDRALVLPLVEADRREQLGRAQAAAERRVERRQGLGIEKPLKEKLLAQARVLRERIGQQFGRVKEWIAGRFPDTVQQLKERTRAVFEAAREKARGAERQGPAAKPERAPSSDKKRGMFDGLRLRADRLPAASAPPAERDLFSQGRFSAPQEFAPGPVRDRAAEALHPSVDRYARAWMDALRMREKDDSDEDEGPTAAERAFDALRTEVAGVRRAMQSLPEVIKAIRPADTAETLGAIAKKLEILGSFMAAIEQHPAIRTPPAQYRQTIATAGEGLINDSVRELDRAKAAAVAERRELAAMIGTLHGRWKQWEWLAWTGIGAFFLGLMIAPLFTRALPFGWDGEVAAFIMNADRWDAGAALMKAQNPDAWNVLMAAGKLTADNAALIGACKDAAAKSKKEQHCSIVVSVP